MRPVPCIFSFFLALLAASLPQFSNAQRVEVVNKTDFQAPAESQAFIFWEAATDTALLAPIATVRISGFSAEASLENLFDRLKSKAQKLGANAFRVDAFSVLGQQTHFALKVYYATDTAVKQNMQNQEKNVVYVFGDLNPVGSSVTFKADKMNKEVRGGRFVRLLVEAGKELRLSKGGITGASMTVKAKEKEPALFLAISGFGLTAPPVYAGAVGIGFNTGNILPLNKSFGRMLVTLLKPE